MNNDFYKDETDAARFARLNRNRKGTPEGDSRCEDEGYVSEDQKAELHRQLHPGTEDDDHES